MDRRTFLALVGVGAAGAAGGEVVLRRGNADGGAENGRDSDGLVATSTGQQRIVWSVDTRSPAAALTFDDGPDPDFTPRILDILAEHDVRATFFALGYNAVRHPTLLKEVVAAGHEIGSHGWRHLNLADLSPEETRREIEHGTALVEDRAERPVSAFRPPYGRFTDSAVQFLAQRRQDLYVWSVTRGRLSWRDPQQVADHVHRSTSAGDIIDLHDGIGRGTFQRHREFARQLADRRRVEIEALPHILGAAKGTGLKLTTVSELVGRFGPA